MNSMKISKKLSFFLLLFLFFFYTTSLFENWSINYDFQEEMRSRVSDIKYISERIEGIPPRILFYRYKYNKNFYYIDNQYVEFYTTQPSIFSWIPLQTLRLYHKAYYYNGQIMSTLGNSLDPFLEEVSKYRVKFQNTVDINSYSNIENLWRDYKEWLMNKIPTYEEIKQSFEDIPEKLNDVTNEDRLKEFYEKRMEMIKENYENKEPEKILYDIEILKNLNNLAENEGAILVPENHGKLKLEKFEDQEIPYNSYLTEVTFISLFQTLFVFIIYWKKIKKTKNLES